MPEPQIAATPPTPPTELVPAERWAGRQLQEIVALACTAEATARLDAERLALVVAHALAHGPHQRGKCETCDAGRAWLEAWLLGRADAPRELVELRRVAAMSLLDYQRHWGERVKGLG